MSLNLSYQKDRARTGPMGFIEKEITTNKLSREKFFKGSKEFFDYLSSYWVDLKSVRVHSTHSWLVKKAAQKGKRKQRKIHSAQILLENAISEICTNWFLYETFWRVSISLWIKKDLVHAATYDNCNERRLLWRGKRDLFFCSNCMLRYFSLFSKLCKTFGLSLGTFAKCCFHTGFGMMTIYVHCT